MAAAQHGVFALWQLAEGGITRDVVRRRREGGRWYPVQPFVYSLTPFVSRRGRFMAAALTYGPGAVLSHGAAAAIWDLRGWPSGAIDVTVPVRRKGRAGVRLHRAAVERVVRDGFPVTTVARTLVDQAADLPLGRLREHGRRGAKKIRAVLTHWTEPEPTRSELERAFRSLCETHDVPLPSQNVSLLGYEVDAYWPEAGLVVELDGWEVTLAAALAAAIRSGCPRAEGRGRAPARAAAPPPSGP